MSEGNGCQWTEPYLALASLTFTRGRARSSLRRWLCSIKRLSLSSDIDWRPPARVLIVSKTARVSVTGNGGGFDQSDSFQVLM